MDGAVREVDDFFRMAQGKAGATARMSSIGGTRRIASSERIRHRSGRDRTSPRPVADSLVLSIPVRSRKPDFNLDIGITRRRQSGGDAAKGRPFTRSDVLGKGN